MHFLSQYLQDAVMWHSTPHIVKTFFSSKSRYERSQKQAIGRKMPSLKSKASNFVSLRDDKYNFQRALIVLTRRLGWLW